MYDPMIGKLIVWDADRESATRRMVRALGEYEIGELKTLLPFHEAILQTDQWASAETCRDLIEDRAWLKTLAFPKAEKPADGEPRRSSSRTTRSRSPASASRSMSSAPPPVRAGVTSPGGAAAPVPTAPPCRRRPGAPPSASAATGTAATRSTSPLQGTVFKVVVEQGATVQEGALICVIEAMKMENEITAHKSGRDRARPSPSAPRCPSATRSP